MRNYLAVVLGDDLVDGTIPADRPRAVGDDGVIVMGGGPEGVTVLVRADDEDDAERRIIATFGDVATIDDLGESSSQEPYVIAKCGCIAWADETGSPCAQHDPGELRLLRLGGDPELAEAAENWDLIAHALAPCDDPDCEIHNPEVAVAEGTATRAALAWFLAGAVWAREHPGEPLTGKVGVRP